MPNRILRDWTDSYAVNALSVQAERVFVRLIMKVDDFGRLTGDVKILRPMLFPLLLDQVREADLQRLIAECVKAGLVRLYTCNGREFLEIQNFKQRSRAERSKCPDPPDDGHMTVMRPPDDGQMLTETKAETKTKTDALGLPPDLDDPGLREAWTTFIDHRSQMRKRLTPKAATEKFKDFRKWGIQRSIQAIHNSVSNGWQGIFEPAHNGRPTEEPRKSPDKVVIRE